jgi:hypothetical protein
MKNSLVSLLLPAFGLALMLGGSSRPAGAAVQYRESDFNFVRIEMQGESNDDRHKGVLEIPSGALPAPAGGKQTKTFQDVKCSDIVVSVVMADGSVLPAKYDPDARGGCRYSFLLARQAPGRVKVRFPWLPGGGDWSADSPPLTLLPHGTVDGSMSASQGKLTFKWSQVAGPLT